MLVEVKRERNPYCGDLFTLRTEQGMYPTYDAIMKTIDTSVPKPKVRKRRSPKVKRLNSSRSYSPASSIASSQGEMAISQESCHTVHECCGCKKKIHDRYLLKTMDEYWHEDCLKCSCCDCRLGEVGSTLFTKANLMLCRRDYLRLFGSTGYCSACNKMIPAFEMVMRAKGNVYHLECFACQQCNHRFCVGDKFYLCDNKILCEYDYEERMVFASMSYNYNALAQIKRQAQCLSDDMSSGYGSPSPGSLT